MFRNRRRLWYVTPDPSCHGGGTGRKRLVLHAKTGCALETFKIRDYHITEHISCVIINNGVSLNFHHCRCVLTLRHEAPFTQDAERLALRKALFGATKCSDSVHNHVCAQTMLCPNRVHPKICIQIGEQTKSCLPVNLSIFH